MPNNSNNVVVAGSGKVYVGPTTATAPTNYTNALVITAGNFSELGFISEDGATFTEGKDITDIGAWQSFYPLRKIVTGRTMEISFALREFNKRAVEFALGGTVSTTAAEWKYVPPAPDALTAKSLVLEWTDGTTKGYRLYVPTGLVTEAVETNLTRTSSADLPITFSATDPGTGTNIYTLFTNDVAFSS